MIGNESSELELREVLSPSDFDAARHLIREYAATLAGTICMAAHEEEMRQLTNRYPVAEGGIWLAVWSGRAVGCVALRRHLPNPNQGVIKRLYVTPEFRGRGIARRLMRTAFDVATARGYTSVHLDTLPSMEAAQGLYHNLGFRITRASTGPDDPVEMERPLP